MPIELQASMQVGLRKCPLDLGSNFSHNLVGIGAFRSSSGTTHGGAYILAKDGRVAYVPNGATSAQRAASTPVRISLQLSAPRDASLQVSHGAHEPDRCTLVGVTCT
jgi:hypothetical protein